MKRKLLSLTLAAVMAFSLVTALPQAAEASGNSTSADVKIHPVNVGDTKVTVSIVKGAGTFNARSFTDNGLSGTSIGINYPAHNSTVNPCRNIVVSGDGKSVTFEFVIADPNGPGDLAAVQQPFVVGQVMRLSFAIGFLINFDTTMVENTQGRIHSSVTISEGAVVKEPPAPKVAAYYDPNAPGKWFLMEKVKSDNPILLAGGYEYAESATSTEWTPVPSEGFDMKASTEPKTTLFIRTAEFGKIPASKAAKLKPANLGKPTKYKIDYKKEIIKLKAVDRYSTNNGDTWREPTLNDKGKPIPLDVKAFIGAESSEILIRKEPTGKKPATEQQKLETLPRGKLFDAVLDVTNGKVTSDMKKYEIWNENVDNPAKSKWGKIPKITTEGEHTFEIRLKAVPKGANAAAASASGTLRIRYGEYEDSKGNTKTGIRNASISGDGKAPPVLQEGPVKITKHPESTYVTQGSDQVKQLTVETTTELTGGTIVYEWWHRGLTGPNTRVQGANQATLTIPTNLAVGVHEYSVKVWYSGKSGQPSDSRTAYVEVLPPGMEEPTESPSFRIVANRLNNAMGGPGEHTLYEDINNVNPGTNLVIELNWGRGDAAATGITSIKFGNRTLEPGDYTVDGTKLTILHSPRNWFDSLDLDWFANMDWRRLYTVEIIFNDDFDGLEYEGKTLVPASAPKTGTLTIRDNATLPSFPDEPAQIIFDKSQTAYTAPGYTYTQISFTGLTERGYGRKATTTAGANAAYTAAYIVDEDGENARLLVLNTDYERDIAGSGLIRFRQGSTVLNGLPNGKYILRVISNNPPYNTVLERQILTIIG